MEDISLVPFGTLPWTNVDEHKKQFFIEIQLLLYARRRCDVLLDQPWCAGGRSIGWADGRNPYVCLEHNSYTIKAIDSS
jgi:hypothetical protein